MQLGQLVVGQVDHREALLAQVGDQGTARIAFRVGLHANEDMRLAAGVVAVVEFGDLALAHRLAERLEATGLLGNGHGDDGFAALTQLGALGHVAQAVEVDVGAGIDGHQGLPGDATLLDVLLDPCHPKGPGRFGDRAGIVVDILDCRTDLVGADRDDLVDVVLADIEGVLADLRHGHAVGEDAHARQHHPLAGGHGHLQAVGIVRLDTDDPDFRAQVFHVCGDAGDQAAATDRYEDRIQRAGMLAQDLHRHRALPGNGVGIVIRMDVDVALLVHQLQRIGQRLGEGIAVQHHLAATGTHAFDLDLGSGLGHHDGGLDPQHLGGQGQALGMVARRCSDHATGALGVGELGQLVVGATDLEREHRLQVFALEPDLVAQPLGELAGGLQWGFHGNVINARGEDLLYVLFEHRKASLSGLGRAKESNPAFARATTRIQRF